MKQPDPSLLQGVVADEVLDALKMASQALKRVGVRHVVVGGLAVGANGHPRATDDVDFLVGDEAFERHEGGVLTLRPGVPFQVGAVGIDLLSARDNEPFLAAALDAEPGSMVEAPALVYLKLKSPRLQDRADVVELIKSGIDVEACHDYLTRNAHDLLEEFEEAVERAWAERDRGGKHHCR